MARSPLDGKQVASPHGGYGYVRTSSAQGACGVHGYPCTHAGIDLVAPKGTPVKAPHAGWLMVVRATDQPPFSGYGPAVVLIAHDDADDGDQWALYDQEYHHHKDPGPLNPTELVPVAHRYSLLAHLDPDSLTANVPLHSWTESEDNYYVADNGVDWLLLSMNPDLMFGEQWGQSLLRVKEGEVVGKIGDAGHVHWEVRRAPYETGLDHTVDPFKDWLAAFDPLVNPPVVGTVAGGIPWWLWLLVGYAVTRRHR
jgi:murein DD-endopeptidase MepM/ murein hydrolase activator NlpD